MTAEAAAGTEERTGDAKIELRNVTKRYPEITAVDDLSIEIADNELVAFLGPSGSGKTTTLNMIAGLEQPTAGEVLIDGEVVNGIPARDRDVGLVFQNLALFEKLSVRENLGFAHRIDGASDAEIREVVERVADVTNLEEMDLDRNVNDLTPSKRQRVALGRAIAAEPTILLLDEPMSNLDREEAIDMRAEIKRLQDRLSQTMVYVTHDQEEAMSLADRIMVIHQGQLHQFGTPQELYSRPANRFVAGFIGSPSMNFFDGTFDDESLELLSSEVPGTALEETFEGFVPNRFTGVAEVGIRPEHLQYGGGTPFEFTATYLGKEPLGPKSIVFAEASGEELTIVTKQRPDAAPGDRVTVGADYDDFYLIDPSTDEVVY